MWGGRFEGEPDAAFERLNSSLPVDGRLWPQDIQASIAHAEMLGDTGILSSDEAQRLAGGLRAIAADLETGAVALPSEAEDVHSAVETLLYDRVGDVAGKLHTARSRNDQVVTDLRLYLRSACRELDAAIGGVQQALLDAAVKYPGAILPGYTHLQHAQPVLLAHHLLAYFWMVDRDRERIHDCAARINRLPLGAAALAGTPFPIDRQKVAQRLGFASVLPNSMDAVSDRDFAVELLSCVSIVMMHLSRFAEEMVLWSSREFGFIIPDDSVSTGSSIMPQKKNPDAAELIRGKTGRVYGDLLSLLTTLKGLPLSYNRDLQEDKAPVFDALDTALDVLPVVARIVAASQFRSDRMAGSLRGDFSTATDLADHLASLGMPFREAHDLVGRLVRACLAQSRSLEDLTTEEIASLHPLLSLDPGAAQRAMGVASSIAARSSEGGTAPTAVDKQLQLSRARLLEWTRG